MISIELKGLEIADREEMHRIFREALSLEDYYGCNLDALYDVLSTYSEEVEIHICNKDSLCENVPFYGERLVGMLYVAQEENPGNIKIFMDDEEVEDVE